MLRTTLLLIASCLLACGPATSGLRAHELYDRGDYRGAERAADRELATAPEHPELWRIKIDAVLRSGDSKRAVDLYMQWHRLRRHYDTTALRAMAVSTLWRAISEPPDKVRVQALDAIARLGLEALYDAAAEHLDDDSELVSATAAALLADRSPRARARAMALWRSGRPAVRAVVVAGLGRTRAASIHDELVSALDDPSPRVRRAAVRALARALSEGVIARLVEVARADDSGMVRAAALRALARSEHEQGPALARAALADAYVGARLAAVALLSRRPDESHDSLVELATSSDLYVALRAMVALRSAGKDVPFHTVQWALAHRDWTVRVAALNALTEIVAGKVALGLVEELLADSRAEVRLAAARVLLQLGRPGPAAEVFAAALQAPRDEPRLQAAIDLIRMGDDRGRRALTRLGSSPSAATRRAAARAHRHLANPTLPLVAALGDPAAAVRVAAAETLLMMLNR